MTTRGTPVATGSTAHDLSGGPLTGVRVIEACQMVSGPLAAMLLADMGADVIKVEEPVAGDRYRWAGTSVRQMSTGFAATNRGKRSLCADVRSPAGLQAVQRLAASADVFIQNFRPGVATRIGIGPDALLAANPDLIYVSITGFGPDGPYADQKVYDYVVQAITGMASLQDVDGRPSLVKNIVIDKVTAYTVTQAVTAALFARSRGAGGQHIEISMLDVGLSFMWPDAMSDHLVIEGNVRHQPHMSTYYEIRPTSDGFVAQMAISDRQFPGLCRALGTETWLDDPRFATMEHRVENASALGELIDTEFAKFTSSDLLKRLHANDVAAAPVHALGDIHLDPQVQHSGSLTERTLPHLGTVREPFPAARFRGTPTSLDRGAPALGEHSAEVASELGYSDAEVDELLAAGAIGRRN